MGRRGVGTGLVAAVVASAFAAAASVGVAVSPMGTHSAAHEYEYPKKVTICHRTGSKKHPFVTIRVSRRAVRAHLAHGDKLGPCSMATFVVCHKSRKGKQTIKVVGIQALRKHLRPDDRLGSCRKGHKDKGKHGKKKRDSDRGKRGHG